MTTHPIATARRPKVSVCVITYNQEKYIGECLQSIVDQRTSFEFELIVGDDVSKDRTREVVAGFAMRHPGLVRPIYQERNIGSGTHNLRAVHLAARGEYVAHVDGDDHWEAGKLEAQVCFLDAHPECAGVFTNSHVISEQGKSIGIFSCGVPETFDLAYLIRDGNFLHHSSLMYRRTLQERMLPDTPEFIDFQLYVRLARFGRLGYIDRPLTSYRASSATSMIHNDNARVRRLVWQSLREVSEFDAPRRSIRHADASFLSDAAWQALRSGRPGRFLPWLALARQRPGFAPWATHFAVLTRLLRSLLSKANFRARARLGLSRADTRVFYPKG